MIIIHSQNAAYYAPPKTGTTAIIHALRKLGLVSKSESKGKHVISPAPAKYFHFITVRNPYSRFFSIWIHLRNTEVRRKKTWNPRIAPGGAHPLRMAKFKSFHKAISYLASINWQKDWPELFVSCQMAAMHHVDAILKMESLEQDFRKLPFIPDDYTLEVKSPVPGIPLDHNKQWYEHYDAETRKVVADAFREEFECSGYSVDDFQVGRK
jgi:hypothetical protein